MTDGIEVEVPQLQGPLDAVELHRAGQVVTPLDLLAVVVRQQDVTSLFRHACPIVNVHEISVRGDRCLSSKPAAARSSDETPAHISPARPFGGRELLAAQRVCHSSMGWWASVHCRAGRSPWRGDARRSGRGFAGAGGGPRRGRPGRIPDRSGVARPARPGRARVPRPVRHPPVVRVPGRRPGQRVGHGQVEPAHRIFGVHPGPG